MHKQMRVSKEEVSRFLSEAFEKTGLGREFHASVVDQMVVSSLRGVDSHGVILTERYVQGIREGRINRSPRMKRLRDNPSTALIDGDRGPGQYVAKRAVELASSKAKRYGMGCVFVTNLGHIGALSYFGLLLAKNGMAGMVVANGDAMAAPWGGISPVFGTNPICFAFPHKDFPIVLDIATTVVAGKKIDLAASNHKSIPEGWALNREGLPTTDPEEALRGTLLPFGGYKGYGIMFSVELYSAIIGGGVPGYLNTDHIGYTQGGLYVQALRIDSVSPYQQYLDRLEDLARATKSSRPVPGQEGIYLPGEMEARTLEEREKKGIPVDRRTWNYFAKLAKELRLPALEAMGDRIA